ncbi:MAG: SDR family NAD(P)-dependent oxidoreductase [Ilumatobacteraceae bacterium]
MKLGLDGANVVVAGSSAGIGLGIARGFLAEGANVAISGRTASTLDVARAELEALGLGTVASFAGDMTDSDVVEAALVAAEHDLGPIDCVVANVGLGRAPLGFEVTDDDWDFDIRQNLTGAMFLARSAMRRMVARDDESRRRCSIVFVSSIAGIEALGTPLTYGATKAGLNHAAKALARIAGKHGIRVNTVAPGNIIFSGGNWEQRVDQRPEAWGRWIDREVSLRRFGTPDEIADAVVWLASSRAGFVTGTTLVVDGGQLRS